jgi:hypothetical protein
MADSLAQAALEAIAGNYTAGTEALRGEASIPDPTGEGAVKVPLESVASRVWAAELALLYSAARRLEALRCCSVAHMCQLYGDKL